jgi:hypothetical protein
MKTIQEIYDILNHAHGTEHYHRVSTFMGAPVATDGVVSLAKAAECFWLLDAIISYRNNKCIPTPNFQVWKLTVDTNTESAVLECLDDDKNVVIRQDIEYTEFPLPEIIIWVVSGVIMLPSEY